MNKPDAEGGWEDPAVAAVLGPLEFEVPCGWDPPPGSPPCPLEAEWKGRWSCCDDVQLFCNAHRSSMREWLADASAKHLTCGRPARAGLIVWAPLSRVGWK